MNVNLPKQELLDYFNYENALLTQVLLNESIINRVVFDIYELSEHDRQMILDKEGKIIAREVRGSELDIVLIDHLGDRYEK